MTRFFLSAMVFVTFLLHFSQAFGESCKGNRRQLQIVNDSGVAGKINNDPNRRLCIHLPPSYTTQTTKRYPVIYMLPGLGGTDTSLFEAATIHLSADNRALQTGQEVILVGVDTSTKLGGSYLVPSPLAGDFEHFVATTVVDYVDTHFRTVTSARARALMGHSTGGFNAVSFGLRHADLFQTIAAVSPDGLDLEKWMIDPASSGQKMQPWAVDWMRNDLNNFGVSQMKSYAGDWSPNLSIEAGMDWPVDLNTGTINVTWQKWLQNSPAKLLDDQYILDKARRYLNQRIIVSVGTRDEFGLHDPALAFSQKLTNLGIAHRFVETDDSHASRLQSRFLDVLKDCLDRF